MMEALRRNLKRCLRHFLVVKELVSDSLRAFFELMSPAFVCATLFALLLETCLNKSWEIGATSKILGQLGSKYTMYSIALPILPAAQAIPHRITLTLSNFVSLVFAELPYILAYIDLELCPSLFTTHGLISLAICSSTVADIYIFNGDSQRYLRMRLFTQFYWQSFLRFLGFLGLIVVGTSNLIEKAWRGELVFHKHLLIVFTLYVFAFVRFRESYRRLRKVGKRNMIVVPVD